ncbi:MAG TPA: methyltransferase domain-containing protein [Myxococcota bacterium]|nr:methyltransferase domain-containing protein [Myxococcota bacterium]
MRVVDLDRDMRDVIPTGATRDSEFLFARMTERTLAATRAGAGLRVLDVASGAGQDAAALAARGAFAVAAEPSARMIGLARLLAERDERACRARDERACRARDERACRARDVRAWGDALPFATGSFDAVFCKGALDHFDAPEAAIAEMARVTRREGRVVLAIANFDSLACRVARLSDQVKEEWLGRAPRPGRRHYDVPHDHFTRYDPGLMRAQAGAHLHLEIVQGVSLAWGLPGWSRAVSRLPEGAAHLALRALDQLATRWPEAADVLVLAGRPRRTSSSSA